MFFFISAPHVRAALPCKNTKDIDDCSMLLMLQCCCRMNRVVTDTSHVQKVRSLYKLILRLHRGLPTQMKSLGDDYVRSEFKRHKDAEPQFVPVFMHEWTVTVSLSVFTADSDHSQ